VAFGISDRFCAAFRHSSNSLDSTVLRNYLFGLSPAFTFCHRCKHLNLRVLLPSQISSIMAPAAITPPAVEVKSLKVPRPSMQRVDTSNIGTKRKIICFSDFDGTIFMQEYVPIVVFLSLCVNSNKRKQYRPYSLQQLRLRLHPPRNPRSANPYW
jgi:hypothetical protein